MNVAVERVGDIAIVALNVEQLDASNADDMRRELDPILGSVAKLILDLDRVEFADSRGCGVILSCLKTLSQNGGDLKLCRVTEPVRTVFSLIRLHKICEIVGTREEAIKAFGG